MELSQKIKLLLLICALKEVSENTKEINIKNNLQEIVSKLEIIITNDEEIKKALQSS